LTWQLICNISIDKLDPAPFYEKELDREAEQYIVDIVRDFPKKTEFRIVVYLPGGIPAVKKLRKFPSPSGIISCTWC
jgi:hypothetical protein